MENKDMSEEEIDEKDMEDEEKSEKLKDSSNIKEDSKDFDSDDIGSEDNDEEVLESRLKQLEKEKEDITDQLIRLQADFMNFKKRSEKEKQATINFAVEGFISELLPILDNFKRALNSEEDKESSFYEGIELIFNELNKLLSNNGVVEMEAVGEDFDPSLHHAVVMEEDENFEEGKVIEVLQTGYMMKDKVIRPCMVKVSK